MFITNYRRVAINQIPDPDPNLYKYPIFTTTKKCLIHFEMHNNYTATGNGTAFNVDLSITNYMQYLNGTAQSADLGSFFVIDRPNAGPLTVETKAMMFSAGSTVYIRYNSPSGPFLQATLHVYEFADNITV